jgi:hypothetical protein
MPSAANKGLDIDFSKKQQEFRISRKKLPATVPGKGDDQKSTSPSFFACYYDRSQKQTDFRCSFCLSHVLRCRPAGAAGTETQRRSRRDPHRAAGLSRSGLSVSKLDIVSKYCNKATAQHWQCHVTVHGSTSESSST